MRAQTMTSIAVHLYDRDTATPEIGVRRLMTTASPHPIVLTLGDDLALYLDDGALDRLAAEIARFRGDEAKAAQREGIAA